ncbi:50S ribosomal protein L18 [Pseudobythopirellula maris]|uniref:Large ribosomal subunit protein uL18 n=1 Tax=Pseudobythopirellula maris TaxID=2527991 RepID=A0A5C5ZM97_9BACT|nr:50S ribosomal protein L18 [Pseudobythopirellula maris]TWT88107.1 50S ribosomal protein L18 [Pseudobythopirellula maris]
MEHSKAINKQRIRRSFRVRKRLKGTAERPRLSVNRSHKNISVQLIDDEAGKTLASVSTLDKALGAKYGGNADAAVTVGKAIAEKAQAAGVKQVCFDRGPYKYHGRVAALAEAAREAGLSF